MEDVITVQCTRSWKKFLTKGRDYPLLQLNRDVTVRDNFDLVRTVPGKYFDQHTKNW
jgi:hypothetical protein